MNKRKKTEKKRSPELCYSWHKLNVFLILGKFSKTLKIFTGHLSEKLSPPLPSISVCLKFSVKLWPWQHEVFRTFSSICDFSLKKRDLKLLGANLLWEKSLNLLVSHFSLVGKLMEEFILCLRHNPMDVISSWKWYWLSNRKQKC